MSRTKPTTIEAIAVTTECSYCGAAPNTWCKVIRRWYGANRPEGQRPYAPDLHWTRLGPIQRLSHDAWREGAADTALQLENEITNAAYGRWRLTTVEKVLDRLREMRELYTSETPHREES